MTTAGRMALYAFRNDPLRLTLSVRGLDLTGATFAFCVRLYPDAPGDPLIGPLENTVLTGASGVRLVTVDTVSSVPTTILEIIASKTAMQALPAAAEAGSDLTLSFDFQWTPQSDGLFAPVEVTRLYGNFVVKGSVND